MSDQMRAAREDLAFLRAVAEDKGPMPGIIGQHMLVVGVLYGINVLAVWAGQTGLIPWPAGDQYFLGWLPATVLHIPYALWFTRQTHGIPAGPTLKMFAVAWGAMVLMTVAIVASIFIARAKTGLPYENIWPPVAVALYGGSWTVVSRARKSLGYFLVALGCFATSMACAATIGTPQVFLALGLGIVLFLGGPGLAIMLKAKE